MILYVRQRFERFNRGRGVCTKNRQRESEKQSSKHRNPHCGLFLLLAFTLFYLSGVRLHIPLKYLWPLLLLATGCAAERSRSAWIMAHGGLAAEKDQAQLRGIVSPMVSKYSTSNRPLSVQVLDAAAVGAFSWDNGQIFITRGLIDILDEDELLAVVAHELGHIVQRHAQVVSALQGCKQDVDAEARADLIGVEILRRQGVSPAAMPHMLQKIMESQNWPSECGDRLQHRIDSLAQRPD